jgi:Fe-S cluster assembly iron-binding protein IscA
MYRYHLLMITLTDTAAVKVKQLLEAEGATETLLQPSLGARAAISGCVFAQPPVEQAKLFPKASLANSDALIENAGIKLSFDSLRQLEMRNAGKPPKSQGKGASRGGKR